MARLLFEQGYAATGRLQLLDECGVSNGSLYHHFPDGMEELAEAALEASGRAVAATLREALERAPSAGAGIGRFLDLAAKAKEPGCPIAPAALESPIVSPRLRVAAKRCFDEWQALIETRLRVDRWPQRAAQETASAVLALVEGALLLTRVTHERRHLTTAKRAVLVLLTAARR